MRNFRAAKSSSHGTDFLEIVSDAILAIGFLSRLEILGAASPARTRDAEQFPHPRKSLSLPYEGHN
jgi:hypothetical protein